MKRAFIIIGLLAIITASFSSCTTSRDCMGGKHTRLANGVTI
ncbi:MAG TPA: hypothetical protein VM368_07690 [Flavisolibacter sp.]|nr:hypothetical protein [Flavisolibacter sp.]